MNFKLFDGKTNIQEDSQEYIRDNEIYIVQQNQKMLVYLNVFFLMMLVMYLIASMTAFASWNVTGFYATMLVIQVVLITLVLLRYTRKEQPIKEVNVSCSLFQLYVMFFVGVMSIIPIGLKQPAVYFAPILMAFVAVFVFPWRQTVLLVVLEEVCYLLAAFFLKQPDVFFIDFFSCVLAFFMAVYIAWALSKYRFRENHVRSKLRKMGMMDLLTELYNKVSTHDLCQDYIDKKGQEACALLILDFDNFKTVNDSFGHQFGDDVLRAFSAILRKEAGDEHIAGRIGGDEFLLFLKNCGSVREAVDRGQRILDKTEIIQLEGQGDMLFSCSIGVDFAAPGVTRSYNEMFARADEALYQVKENGKGAVQYYQKSI